MSRHLLCVFFLLLGVSAVSQTPPAFSGAEQWKTALTAPDKTTFKALYSIDPPARSIGTDGKQAESIAPEIDFWQKLGSSGLSDIEVSQLSEQEKDGLRMMSFQVSMKVTTPVGPRTRYVIEQQVWQPQKDTWRIVAAMHTDVLKMRPATKPNPNLYNREADARLDITQAIAKAVKEHQRVILVFGGNWCYDCHVLDQAFHQADVAPLIEKNFQVVHVDIGDDGKKNNDIAMEYRVPLDKGVPALAILSAEGKLLYSQENGEWESARSLDPDDVIAFLNKWKP